MFYLFMGFAAVWFFVTCYVIYLGVRQRQIEADMRMLQEELQARQK
jgi:CcmD family protein